MGIVRITRIEITDENSYYSKDKPPKYKCTVKAQVMGGDFTVENFTFDAEIAEQFAESFLFQLQARLNDAMKVEKAKPKIATA